MSIGLSGSRHDTSHWLVYSCDTLRGSFISAPNIDSNESVHGFLFYLWICTTLVPHKKNTQKLLCGIPWFIKNGVTKPLQIIESHSVVLCSILNVFLMHEIWNWNRFANNKQKWKEHQSIFTSYTRTNTWIDSTRWYPFQCHKCTLFGVQSIKHWLREKRYSNFQSRSSTSFVCKWNYKAISGRVRE